MRRANAKKIDVDIPVQMPRRDTGYAYRAYRRRKLRQQRLALLACILLAVAALSFFVMMGLARPVQQVLMGHHPVDSAPLERKLAMDFGFSPTPSLLYYDGLHLPYSFSRLHGTVSDKLLPMPLTGEDTVLKAKLQALADSFPPGHFTPTLFYFNPQDGTYVSMDGYRPMQAASVIKLPVLLLYLMSLDRGILTEDEPLLYTEYHKAAGAGELQYKDAGLALPARSVALDMIRISDNTCTNMLISALGGTDRVNAELFNLGLRRTHIENWLPDLEGTNKISAYEMATILHNIDSGPLLSENSRQIGLEILQTTRNNRLLPALLPKDVAVAHKTGDIGTALGDSGILYLPDNRRYILSIQVERPFNDYTARDFFQKAALVIYEHNQSPVAQATP